MIDEHQSYEETYDSYRRIYPLHSGPHKWRRFIGWLDSSDLRVAILVFIFAACVIATLDVLIGVEIGDVLVEAHGLLMDIFVFGCLLLWFNERRSFRDRIRNYQETLVDLSQWNATEGVLKKVAIIKRLEDIGGVKTIPPLDHSQLPEANFQGVNLEGTNFCFANLHYAFLNGTYFKNANLAGARLNSACLHSAVLEGADLRGADLSMAEFSFAQIDGANLGNYTVGQRSPDGPSTYVTDIRGAIGLTEEQLMTTIDWEHAIRDKELACGKPIPEAQETR